MSRFDSTIETKDITFILRNPWSVSKNEWGLRKGKNFIDIHSYIEEHLIIAREGGFQKIWRTTTGTPIAILGCYQVRPKVLETFFFASYLMEKNGSRLTREMRTLLSSKNNTFRNHTCVLYSASTHARQIDWFRLLGFKYVPSKNIGEARYFEYVFAN